MKLSFGKPFVVIALFGSLSCASSAVSAQKNLDVCRLTTDTRSVKEGYGTGIYEIGKFPVDDVENTTRKSFRYETDGRVFTADAEVEYGDPKDVEKGRPTKIILSLLVKLSNDKSSASMVMPIEAGSKYRYKWGTTYVSSDVVIGDVASTFSVHAAMAYRKTAFNEANRNGLRKGGIENYDACKKHDLSLVRWRCRGGGAVLCGDVSGFTSDGGA